MDMTNPLTCQSLDLKVAVPANLRVRQGKPGVRIQGQDTVVVRTVAREDSCCLEVRSRDGYPSRQEMEIDVCLPEEGMESVAIRSMAGKVHLESMNTVNFRLELNKGSVQLEDGCTCETVNICQKMGSMTVFIAPETRESLINLYSGTVEIRSPAFRGDILCRVGLGCVKIDDGLLQSSGASVHLLGESPEQTISLDLRQGAARIFRLDKNKLQSKE